MILAIHITIALASLAFTTLLFTRPSQAKLYISYALIAGTLLSGTYLVISIGTHLLQACATGILYTSAVTFGIAGARRKLAAQVQKVRSR